MLKRLRRSARLKLQSALGEVIHESDRQSRTEQEVRHDQLLAELTSTNGELTRVLGELTPARTDIAAVRERLTDFEERTRRDISYALDVRATAEAAEFAALHMPTVPVRWHPHETLRYALDQV